MSSGGQILGGAIGAVAGFFLGGGPMGAVRGAYLGMTLGGIIDPPKGPTITGPRLDDLSIQTSTYGANIPRVYGTVALNGNVFWLENNKLKEVVKKKKSGGKGGPETTTKTFSYYATFALGLCEGPISGVRRIWCGPDLIYDAGSDNLETIIASNQAGGLFTLHNGAMDQLPDARMQATLGVPNTPAYRGLAYIVFNDFPLEKHSNSLMAAPFKVEIVKLQTTSAPALISKVFLSEPVELYKSTALHMGSDSKLSIFYGSATTKVISGYPTGSEAVDKTLIVASNTHLQGWSDTPVWASITGGSVIVRDSDGNVELISNGVDFEWHNGYYQRGSERILYANYKIWDVSLPTATLLLDTTSGYAYGSIYEIFVGVSYNYAVSGGGTTPYFICYDKSWNVLWSVSCPFRSFSTVGGVIIRENSDGFCIVANGNYFYEVRQSGYTLLGASASWGSSLKFGGQHLLGNLWISYNSGDSSISVVNLYPAVQSLPTLASIIQSECLSSNLLALGDIDTSALTQPVRGYRVSTVAAIRGAIEPLQAAWPFDVIQSGYKIVFKPRGGASVATIPASDLDARGAGESPGVSITNAREMDSVLPRRVVVNYLDVTREYDTGTQADERLNTDSVNIRTIEMAIVLNATEALGIVQTLLYLYWLERYDISFSLPSSYNHLEPGDSITVNSDESTYSLRLTGITYTQDGRLECTAKYDAPAIYVRTAIGEEGTSTGQTITLAGGTYYELMDIPLLLDSLDQPGFPVAMTGYLSGWPGGELLKSDDSGQTWDDLQGFLSPGATIGTASNVIGATVTAMIDKSSVLTVSLIGGELSSVTELAMLNGANYFAYGINGRWEIIAAQNCALQGDGSYILTDLLRGQQGTEWACGLHAVGDKVIALNSSLAFVGASLNSIGSPKTYRGVTLGKTLDSASDTLFTYTGVNLECLSPCYLNGNRNAANDWTITWIRRTRVGGAWRDYVDASLGEASEAYEVDIFSDGTYTTLKRTLTGLSSATAAYTSAQQISDFGLNVSTLYVKVYQLSNNVGRGYPLISSITR